MDNIQHIHEYNRIARRGGHATLRHSCGNAYALRADVDGEPILQCYWCNVKVHPGERMMNEIIDANERYSSNEESN